jgi:hypothetical protein
VCRRHRDLHFRGRRAGRRKSRDVGRRELLLEAGLHPLQLRLLLLEQLALALALAVCARRDEPRAEAPRDREVVLRSSTHIS